MTISNKTYDLLKFLATTFFPALGTLVGTVGIAVGYPEATGVIVTVLTALGTFIGALVGLSSTSYNKGIE